MENVFIYSSFIFSVFTLTETQFVETFSLLMNFGFVVCNLVDSLSFVTVDRYLFYVALWFPEFAAHWGHLRSLKNLLTTGRQLQAVCPHWCSCDL